MSRLSTAILLILAGSSAGWSQTQELTLERIMADPDWLGRQPEAPYWSDDGTSIYFERKVEGSEERQLFVVAPLSGDVRRVDEAAKATADHAGGEWSSDRRFKVYARNGDLFVRNVADHTVRQLTRTEATESSPRFMSGDQSVVFYRGDDIFELELETGLTSQPAVLDFGKDPDAEVAPDYLRDQQRRLIDFVRETKEKDDARRERERKARAEDASRVPSPFYLGEDVELKASSLSPSGKHLFVLVSDTSREKGTPDRMPNYVTDSGYVDPQEVRTLVGTWDPSSERALLLNLETREKHEVSFSSLPGILDDPLAAIRKDHGADSETEENEPKPRAIYVGSSGFDQSALAGIQWSRDGRELVLNIFSHDNKDRWMASVDLATGSLTTLERITDEAWINWRLNEIGFLSSSEAIFFTSEASGYSQLYLRPITTGDTKRLTHGEFVVSDVSESPDGRYLYYKANVEHPGTYEIYRYDLELGKTEQVTTLGGMNDYQLSPDGSRLLLVHSTTTRPPELYVQDARPGASAARLTETVAEAFTAIDWIQPDIVAVPSTHHDRPIYSRIYRPKPSSPSGEKRPAVVFVHGAGYLQNSHAGWSGYFREFMFHTLLTRSGFVVLDMDYRASAGYGRDWRTAIYRQMGTPELEDLEDGIAYLASHENVDRERIGVYGGSYGGFITFMAMFKHPDMFAAGAALRPVTDWAHYNHSYTSRILNTPSVDPEAYEKSSPLEFAEGLSKPLLIAHGVLDDNVFFKDSVRLVQRLIELEKTDWEMAIYPVEAHGFREPSSWLDEYRRIFDLFQTHLH